MNVLATRTLIFTDDKNFKKEVPLTVFVPFEAEDAMWKCGFVFGPPIERKIAYGVGADFLQALVGCLQVARGYFESTDLSGRAHWDGMVDCGLPWHKAEPAPLSAPGDVPPADREAGTIEVLATRGLSYSDENGNERDLRLTIFAPFKAEGEMWRCRFTFGPPLNASLRYGSGADFLEALLDALAMARAHLETTDLKGRVHFGGMDNCGLPYKIGRSFWMERASRPPSDVPDTSAR